MKKIILIIFVLALLIFSGCSKEASQDTEETSADEQGYVTDIDQQLDNSDINSLDEDLNMDWV